MVEVFISVLKSVAADHEFGGRKGSWSSGSSLYRSEQQISGTGKCEEGELLNIEPLIIA